MLCISNNLVINQSNCQCTQVLSQQHTLQRKNIMAFFVLSLACKEHSPAVMHYNTQHNLCKILTYFFYSFQ